MAADYIKLQISSSPKNTGLSRIRIQLVSALVPTSTPYVFSPFFWHRLDSRPNGDGALPKKCPTGSRPMTGRGQIIAISFEASTKVTPER
jgi:hypothetical protein